MGILIDIWESEHNDPLIYPQIDVALRDRGVQLSRTRWSYLINGTGSLVTDRALLEAIADFFGVPGEYLSDLNSSTPAEVENKMSFIAEMRKLKVKNFAARNLGATSPETLKFITEIIDASMKGDD
jgi:hypothetical protein